MTEKNLEVKLEFLNGLLHRPKQPWTQNGKGLVAQVGCLHLACVYGGYNVEEMSNEGGGVSHPFGFRVMSKPELGYFLDAVIAGVRMTGPKL